MPETAPSRAALSSAPLEQLGVACVPDTAQPCQEPDSRLIRGIAVRDPHNQFTSKDVTDREVEKWQSAADTTQYEGWQWKVINTIRSTSPEFNRQKNQVIAQQMADDWRSIGDQIEACQDRVPGQSLVRVTHPDGAHETGIAVSQEDGRSVRHGTWIVRTADGQMAQRARYHQGVLDGPCVTNDQYGHVFTKDTYERGILREHRQYDRGQWQRIVAYDRDGEELQVHDRQQQQEQRQRQQGYRSLEFGGR